MSWPKWFWINLGFFVTTLGTTSFISVIWAMWRLWHNEPTKEEKAISERGWFWLIWPVAIVTWILLLISLFIIPLGYSTIENLIRKIG